MLQLDLAEGLFRELVVIEVELPQLGEPRQRLGQLGELIGAAREWDGAG